MQKHHIFLIHGITDETSIDKDYKELCNLLRKNYKKQNKRILDEDFELIPVKWQDKSTKLSRKLYERCFGELEKSDKVLVASDLNPAEQASGFVKAIAHTPDALQLVVNKWNSFRPWRYFSTLFLGDLVAYVSKNNNGIRQSVWNQMKPYLDKPEVPPFSIIGHSLGSKVAFDFVNSLFDQNGPELFDLGVGSTNESISKKQLTEIKSSFVNLYTMGTQIPLYLNESISDLENDKGDIDFERIINPFSGLTNKWLNFVDCDDVSAYPVEPIFNCKNNLDKPSNPRDVLVKSGWIPQIAHSNYWKNKIVAEEIIKSLPLVENAEVKEKVYAHAH